MPVFLDNNTYYSTSVPTVYTTWEIEFDRENKSVYLFDRFALINEQNMDECLSDIEMIKIGDSLFSFLEMDWEKYNKEVDVFFKEYREDVFLSEKIDRHVLESFTNKNDHPYIFSLDTYQLSEMHCDVAIKCLKIDVKMVNILRDLIYSIAGKVDSANKFTKEHDSSLRYISNIENMTSKLFCSTETLQQRVRISFLVKEGEQTIDSHRLAYRYSNINPISFAITELLKILEWGFSIRCCKNCNKLFIPDSNHVVDYCNRVNPETGFTCKKVGAAAQYKTKVNAHPILKEYTRAYKRNFARIGKAGMNNERFRIWVEEATQKRDEFVEQYNLNPSENIISEFKKYLGNK